MNNLVTTDTPDEPKRNRRIRCYLCGHIHGRVRPHLRKLPEKYAKIIERQEKCEHEYFYDT